MWCQLLVLDPDKRIPLEDVQKHPWIVKHCATKGGERGAQRASGSKDSSAEQS